jgi:hypothetical protein
MENNRNDFNQCTALIFELLYQEFPRETDVVVEDLVESLDDEMADNYFATILFLQREGLIRYQNLYFSTFNRMILTAKGLKVMDTIPDMIKPEQTMAQQISHALSEDNEQLIHRVIRDAIKLSC